MLAVRHLLTPSSLWCNCSTFVHVLGLVVFGYGACSVLVNVVQILCGPYFAWCIFSLEQFLYGACSI